jgi:UDP-N-acetylglucosamine--N-acetylmuramyl-(pentapeptide) pyrophosphoryl-undecaprenol N-acetylglucosamine transferase
VYPAIALAEQLRADDPELTIRFVVDARPASAEAVRRAGFECTVLPLHRGLQRSLRPAAIVASLRAGLALVASVALALWAVLRARPAVVVGFGAYVTVPVVLAARARRVPILVHEQNGTPGLANRLAVRLGARAAVSVPGTALRDAVLTGNPIRADIVDVRRRPVDPPLVAFVGASLGAGVLNDVALGLYDRWRDRDDVAIQLVTGPDRFAACTPRLAALRRAGDRLDFVMVPFEHDMAGLYEHASIMVTRGGGSIWELAASGMPAIVVPWAGATDDHQSANAAALAAAGGAVHLPERECTVERMAQELDALLADPQRRRAMGEAMRGLARPDAAIRLAELVHEAVPA